MRKIMILSLLALLFSIACTEEEPKVEELTFADIEQEFNFPKPLTSISKELILERYGNLENYREFLLSITGKTSKKSGSKALWSITLKTPDDKHNFKIADDVFILDGAEEEGINLPFSCRSGACSSCMMKLESGEVDQSEQSYLGWSEMEAGWVISCSAYLLMDSKLLTHQEDNFHTN